ncbi:hypothetical protein A7K50_09640 [Dehalobacter sp. MCB1]|uniref:4Fe-4S dicluster domain-containing protein n=1 Tax=unclassified Dehalobacter TaxID=2635733 RepID=UPI000E6D0D95|nr:MULTISPECIES: reductive dehalogenase domain-containing protein [unclassified Dehalobacter]RJE48505.1 hypothetical protein A7K50_09640 [Dehalobacter sp. MCB1]TCX54831.1 hypothetical protein C1I38_03875 [Dehalobacter sp. 12DCB1]
MKYDEHDNALARYELKPGSREWIEYYEKHPDLEKTDLSQFDLPGTLGVGARVDNMAWQSLMSILGQLGQEDMVDGPVDPVKIEMTPERAAEKVKGFAKHILGASVVKIGPLNQEYVYSVKGRSYHRHGGVEIPVGLPINLPHKNAIFLVEGINYDILKGAPKKEIMLEIFRAYSKLGHMAVLMARFIRNIGYPARAHIVTNNQVIFPPAAIDAGVGELGRSGILISKEFGTAMKMSVITTDLPLVYDRKSKLGVDDFCKNCKICAENCPGAAISMDDEKQIIRGVERYRFKAENCFKIWNKTGTDCGVCMSACPYSKPPSLEHSFGLWLAAKGGSFPGIFLTRLERLIYGPHSPGKHPHPQWMEEPPDVWKEFRFDRRKE